MAFVYIFLGLFVYGLFMGKLGAAFLSLFLAGGTVWAIREMRKQDEAWAKDPCNAATEHTTTAELDKQECESSRSEL